jgi:hypothetical protein
MFSLQPDGDKGGSGSGTSGSSAKFKFFGKLTLYFIAVRAAHVYFSPAAGGTSGEGGSASSTK